MEMLSVLLTLSEGNPQVTGGFPSQGVSNPGFDLFLEVSLNDVLNKRRVTGDLRRHDAHLTSL